jgi:D-beta-D-heptose 7-phosphate kinase/D-beta-D-heptose 1-phosphate adenosyltransferase
MKAIKKFLEINESGHWAARNHTLSKPGEEDKEVHSRKAPRIAVIGDAMIDEYYEVEANRISPEFPIPVMKLLKFEDGDFCKRYPGGAANVAYQLKNFNFDVGLFFGEDLEDIFHKNGMKNIYFNKEMPGYINRSRVPVKKRFWDREKDFPLCRIDVEEKNYGIDVNRVNGAEYLDEMRKDMTKYAKEFKPYVTIYSDYDKGMFSDITEPIIDDLDPSLSIVDPKNGPLSKWKGCTIIKPNAKEAEVMSGETDWKKQADYFHDQTDCTAVVITQAGKGVVGKIGYDGYFEYFPETEVFAESVVGAGDCFTAFLAMCMSHQMDLLDAIKVAFEAGRVYVQRKHNKPVTPKELLKHADSIMSKFATIEELKDRDYKLVFTNGCFDIMHLGHLHILEKAKSKGDKLVVAINTDESVKMSKGESRPILPLEQRKKMIAALECVDFVIEFSEKTPYNLIKEIIPDALAKGEDWKGNVVGSDIVKEVHLIPLLEGFSTTNIIEKIKKS